MSQTDKKKKATEIDYLAVGALAAGLAQGLKAFPSEKLRHRLAWKFLEWIDGNPFIDFETTTQPEQEEPANSGSSCKAEPGTEPYPDEQVKTGKPAERA